VNQYNSFAGNLPYELERAKFMKLHETILKNFGAAPLIYRAGRYGIGPNTAQILREAGIAIDTSIRSRFDYSGWGGPNFRDLELHPWWVDRERTLMEMPLTSPFAGLLRHWGQWLFPALWRIPKAQGILARLRLLERIPSPPKASPSPRPCAPPTSPWRKGSPSSSSRSTARRCAPATRPMCAANRTST
jgi:hypothetical protein